MLRPWINSEKVNTLSVYSERFFTRLIMVVDDYGCFHANEKLLRSNLFPLLLEVVKEADISRWLTECQKAGLIVIYDADGKKYLQILDFRQRLDRAKAKYPLPTTSLTIVNDSPPEAESESESERVHAPDLSKSNLFRQPKIPTKQQVLEAIVGVGGTTEMAKSFYEKYESTGWYLNGSPIVNYVSLASKFVTNWRNNDKGKKTESVTGPTLTKI